MVIPPAEQIEGACDDLRTVPVEVMANQYAELHEATGARSDDYKLGYALGLQVARRMIASNVAIAQAKIGPGTIL